MTSRLPWNPDLSGTALMDEFPRLHYGKAAPPIRRLLDLFCDHARASGADKNCFAHARDYAIDEAMGRAGLEMIDEAERAQGPRFDSLGWSPLKADGTPDELRRLA